MENGEYKYVENADGTYTEYFKQDGDVVRGNTYSARAIEESDRLFGQTAMDSGTTSQGGSVVAGADSASERVSKAVTEELRYEGLYHTDGQAEVGSEFLDESQSLDAFPSDSTLASLVSEDLEPVGGALTVGLAIGTGIDAIFGWPSFLGAFAGEGANGSYLYESSGTKLAYNYWTGSEQPVHESSTECSEGIYPIGHSGALVPLGLTPGFCVAMELELKCDALEHEVPVYKSHYSISFFGPQQTSCQNGSGIYSGQHVEPICPSIGELGSYGPACATSTYEPDCHCDLSSGVNTFLYSKLVEGSPCGLLLFGEYGMCDYPQSEAEGHPKSSQKGGSTSALAPVKTPVTVPSPASVPAPARHYVIKKAEEEEGEEKGKPLIVPIEEGATIPNPVWPMVPEPGHDELYTEYKTKVESAGFTSVSEYTLPESEIDTEVGPEDVAAPDISPAPGTVADPTTTVRVGVNPSDAPPGGESKGAFTPPTPPGIETPNLGVACTKFPFGVPCWLVSEFSKWVATAEVPKWTIPLEVPLVGWKTELKLNLEFMEPAMEVVRPILALMATIGLVLMFFHFALGGTGSPPGGDADE